MTPDTSHVTVADCMENNPKIIDGLASVAEALEMMEQGQVDALVIDKRDESDEYGLLSIDMIAKDIFAKKRKAHRVSVYEIMVKPAVVVPTTMKARYAIRLLTRLGITRALVTDGLDLAGWVDLRRLCIARSKAESTQTATE